MTISFNDIPANLRLPGVYVEFDNSLAAQSQPEFKLAALGQRLTTGTVAANIPTRILSAAQAEDAFGRGSMLAEMLKRMKAIDPFMDLWAIAQDEAGGGVAATGTITITGTATQSGALNLYVAGTKVSVAVASGDLQNAIATTVAAAINADTTLPVTAAAVANVVTTTCRWKGETGNDIDLRANYYGEKTPNGVTVAIVAMASGATNPDITATIAAMGSEWYNWIVTPYTDATNVAKLETELTSRYSAMRQIGGRAFASYRGSHAGASTYGNGRNSPHISCMPAYAAPEPAYLWAATYASVSAKALAIDPARPLKTLPLPNLKAPRIEQRWTDSERNLLLWDGMSTYTVGNDGSIYIERAITQYQVNAAGFGDLSYLNINTPETLERIRYEQRATIASKFPRHKLASTSEKFGAGQPIATADTIRAELIALYKEFIEQGWCEDLESYKASLIIEIDTANSRVNVQDQPKLIGQLGIMAVQTQFHV